LGVDFATHEVLSFDCYGTLIDWESGIADALLPILATHGVQMQREKWLTTYARLESEIEAAGYRHYRDVLREVLDGIGRESEFTPSDSELAAFAESPKLWPPFPDSSDALHELQQHYRLVILSNIDDDLFAAGEAALGIEFDEIITAQQVGAYKPGPAMFEALLKRCGCAPGKLLHVAQSLFHDIAPARALGLRNVWVNRRGDREGSGATPIVSGDVVPDLEVRSLAELAKLVKEATQ
jgi:2-haloacid dehalogenase